MKPYYGIIERSNPWILDHVIGSRVYRTPQAALRVLADCEKSAPYLKFDCVSSDYLQSETLNFRLDGLRIVSR